MNAFQNQAANMQNEYTTSKILGQQDSQAFINTLIEVGKASEKMKSLENDFALQLASLESGVLDMINTGDEKICQQARSLKNSIDFIKNEIEAIKSLNRNLSKTIEAKEREKCMQSGIIESLKNKMELQNDFLSQLATQKAESRVDMENNTEESIEKDRMIMELKTQIATLNTIKKQNDAASLDISRLVEKNDQLEELNAKYYKEQEQLIQRVKFLEKSIQDVKQQHKNIGQAEMMSAKVRTCGVNFGTRYAGKAGGVIMTPFSSIVAGGTNLVAGMYDGLQQSFSQETNKK